jgi:hypothetical protein
VIGLIVVLGTAIGCSSGAPDNQPKANQGAVGRVTRDANSPTNKPVANTSPVMKE